MTLSREWQRVLWKKRVVVDKSFTQAIRAAQDCERDRLFTPVDALAHNADEMISRAVYIIAGISALYMALSPLLSGYPGRPVWNDALFFASAVCLIMAATVLRDKAQSYSALTGSGLVALVIAYWGALRPLSRRHSREN